MTDCLQKLVVWTVPILFFLTVGQQSVDAQRRERKPISWVNPKLPQGRGLEHKTLASEALGHDVGYVVWTPADYDPSGKTRYPVIYFLHGAGGNESADAGGFSSLVARAIRDGDIPPCVCVFPNGGLSGYRGTVETMIVDELIPLIDSSYPTKNAAAARAIAGFSMGGGGAVRLSLLHPQLFCAAASWGGRRSRDADTLSTAVKDNASALKANHFAMLFVNGDNDHPDAFVPLAAQLKTLAIPQQTVVLEDTNHNLGLYYQRAGKTMTDFLGRQLKLDHATPE